MGSFLSPLIYVPSEERRWRASTPPPPKYTSKRVGVECAVENNLRDISILHYILVLKLFS
jgi:hypothetical protein